MDNNDSIVGLRKTEYCTGIHHLCILFLTFTHPYLPYLVSDEFKHSFKYIGYIKDKVLIFQ